MRVKTQRIYTKNAQYQKFEVLRTNRNKRHRYGEFLVEGVRNLNEAVRNGWEIRSFLYSYEAELSRWAHDMLDTVQTSENFELAGALMAELSGKTDTSELMAIVGMRPDETSQFTLGENPVLVLFDRPSNKGNLGTILRSCDALGISGLLVAGHAVDVYDPEVVAASMGSLFKVPVIRISDHRPLTAWMDELKRVYPALRIVGTSAHGDATVADHDFTTPALLMIGNETDGLSFALQQLCDRMLTIPMAEDSSASSLNVACAASIVFYEIMRQRSGMPDGV